MSKTSRIILAIAILVAAFIIAVAVVAPRIFQVDHYRPELVFLLEQQTGSHVEIGHLSLRVFPAVSIQVDQFTISNPPGFPRENWLSIPRISAALDSAALWHRQIVIRSLDFESPVLRLRSNLQGKWNCEFNPAPAASDPPAQHPSKQQTQPWFSVREISDLKIEHGTVTIITEAPNGQPASSSLQVNGLSARLDHISLQDLLGNPASSPSGLASLISTGVSGALDADELTFGKLRATQLQSTIGTAPARLLLNPIDFKLYGGKTTAKITLQAAVGADSAASAYQIQASFAGVNAAQLLDEFPGLQGALTGTLEGSLNMSGEMSASTDVWAGKKGQGVVVIRNGRWPKLKLNPTLQQLAKIAQLGPASGDLSSFSSITANWRLANAVLTTPSIQIAGKGITGTGSGTVDLGRGGLLSYQGVGHIPAHVNALTNVLAEISGSTLRGNQLSVSFTVRGTLAKPLFQLRPNYPASRPQQGSGTNQNQLPQVLQNLFNAFGQRKP